jgi:antitoxin (DNA-binding transcriptional repressor) of toxin-antitoxin stability system
MKTAGIRQLKASLSACVHEVERGATILVTDRGRVVAELRPPGARGRRADAVAARYDRLVERGLVEPAPAADDRGWGEFRGLGATPGSSTAVLDAERDE